MSDTDKLSKPPRLGADPRVDKFIGHVLNFATTVALSVGAWFINGLTAKMDTMNNVLSRLGTQVAVLEDNGKRAALLETQITEQRIAGGQNRTEIDGLKERVKSLESRRREEPR